MSVCQEKNYPYQQFKAALYGVYAVINIY